MSLRERAGILFERHMQALLGSLGRLARQPFAAGRGDEVEVQLVDVLRGLGRGLELDERGEFVIGNVGDFQAFHHDVRPRQRDERRLGADPGLRQAVLQPRPGRGDRQRRPVVRPFHLQALLDADAPGRNRSHQTGDLVGVPFEGEKVGHVAGGS